MSRLHRLPRFILTVSHFHASGLPELLTHVRARPQLSTTVLLYRSSLSAASLSITLYLSTLEAVRPDVEIAPRFPLWTRTILLSGEQAAEIGKLRHVHGLGQVRQVVLGEQNFTRIDVLVLPPKVP